tara:strand:+ start:55 stop:993 length:939 start_codon:yes stop_codon:yes gene_type:complete
MNLLLLGCSAIAKRRILPALSRLNEIDFVDAASRRGGTIAEDFCLRGTPYDTFDKAIEKSVAEIVYVSTENSTHVKYSERAILSGRHVIVDKPAFLNADDTDRLLELAVKNNVFLGEAIVFLSHPRVEKLKDLMKREEPPIFAQACFSIPPLMEDNFRYDVVMGGGAINDMGPYAAATWRFLFGEEPDFIDSKILKKNQVDTCFSITAMTSNVGCFSGIYGFNSEYQNWISISGQSFNFKLDRFCSPPPDLKLGIEVKKMNNASVACTRVDDCFKVFLEGVLSLIQRKELTYYHENMIADAKFCDRVRALSG